MLSRVGALQLLLVAVVSGCFSASLLQEPRLLAPGKVRSAVGFELGTKSLNTTPILGVRVGVAPRVEARGKFILTQGGELGVNVHAVDGEVWDLLLMPTYVDHDVSNLFDEDSGEAHFRALALPVVLSATLDDAEQLHFFFGPDVRIGRRNQVGWSAAGFHFGAAVAGPNDHGTFIPECSFLEGIWGHPSESGSDEAYLLVRGHRTFSCALGATFGGTHAPYER
ncbi:MAG: hypothetical protein JWN48_1970 [Myxococcaceae bacterium]|nr:hypothetical protein [Myxococcaceae bacterium]